MRFTVQLLAIVIAVIQSAQACDPDFPRVFFALAAGCLTTNDASELLLVQDLNGQWTFPAGSRSRFFQSNENIAQRETNEEAGLDVTVKEQACGEFSISFFDIDIFAGFCCDLVGNPSSPFTTNSPSEIQQVAFLDRETVEGFSDSELRFPEQRGLLLDVIDGNIC